MQALDEVIWQLLHVKDKEQMENLVLGLFTQGEIEEIARRLELVKLLKKGVSQHEIAKRLGIGVATVTRGAKEIKQGRFKYV
ncbi:MAG: helix-turn-helix domain-containing protein [Patescibacteria group bacterium]|nr:helix-turn-helix domain-containing protein [Patescibacteria group bacterium]MDE2589376.1 helix-turn-helix domain-containing protein [Patescibacteria group bacterium]